MVDASLLPLSVAGATGVLHHYYCNLGEPGAWQGNIYHFVDLDLDVVIYPDGRHLLLDEDEFAVHTTRFGYPADVVAATRQAAQDVLALARSGAAPFDGTLAAYHAALR
jgi:protein associated with RNAse G/E